LNNFFKGDFITKNLFGGFLLVICLTSCATLRDSLIIGAGTGAVVCGVAGGQIDGDRSENAIKGAVIGGIVGGITSYLIHGSLESRDARVRKETLLSLERYDVIGREGVIKNESGSKPSDRCFTTREVDGRLVSIPCRYVDDPADSGGGH
jgi:Glycine zipper 2TM domain